MTSFEVKVLAAERDAVAPDGSDVRLLLRLDGASMAHFSLAPGQSSVPVRHQTVEEIWYVVSGRGSMWRKRDGESHIVPLAPGVCLTIPLGTHFQFQSDHESELQVVGVTIPAWPLDRVEAFEADPGPWQPTVAGGPGLGPRDDDAVR